MFGNDLLKLNKTISADSNTDPDDVLNTKTALNKTGHYEIPIFGLTDMPDQKMIDGIKTFQKDNGLKVDGITRPAGPTEKKLGEKAETKPLPKPAPTPMPIIEPIKPIPPHPPKSPIKTKTIDWNELMDQVTTPVQKNPSGELVPKEPKEIKRPQGKTVQERLQSLILDPRYQDQKEEAYRNHVVAQFEKAYPGDVDYDETGKMIQPQVAIEPDEVEGFKVDKLSSNGVVDDLPDDAFDITHPPEDKHFTSGGVRVRLNSSLEINVQSHTLLFDSVKIGVTSGSFDKFGRVHGLAPESIYTFTFAKMGTKSKVINFPDYKYGWQASVRIIPGESKSGNSGGFLVSVHTN